METKIPSLHIFAIAKSAPVLRSVLRSLPCGTFPAALNLVLVEMYDDLQQIRRTLVGMWLMPSCSFIRASSVHELLFSMPRVLGGHTANWAHF